MKFDCGPTKQHKDAQAVARKEVTARRLRNWHRVFAVIPIKLGPHDCRWLEWVERRYPGAFVSTYRWPRGLVLGLHTAEYRAFNG